ncbi:MAG: hypothetical protein ILA34_00940 [Bacteroidaceae bacterium]|nr:hypothetical protein [Bacteroidaceae bacterium]
MPEDFVGFTAVFMSLLLPVVAVVGAVIGSVYRSRSEKELRKSIVEHGASPELARLLVAKQKRSGISYGTLRGGAVLLGLGLGALVALLLGLPLDGLAGLVCLGMGTGLGLLGAFAVEVVMEKKRPQEKTDDDEQPLAQE